MAKMSPSTARAIKQTVADLQRALRTGRGDVRAIVDQLRQKVIVAVAQGERFEQGLTRDIEDAVKDLTREFNSKLQFQMTEDGRRVFVKAIKVVDTAVRTGNPLAALPFLSEQVLDQLQRFRAELITGLSESARQKIITEVQLASMGQKPITDVIRSIGKNLRGKSIFANIAARADVIYTTEMGRIHSIATQKRMDQSATMVEDLQKRWLHSHIGEPRPGHLELDGMTIPTKERFPLLGRDGITYHVFGPYDPILPPSEAINCRCSIIPVVERFEKEFPNPIPRRVLQPGQFTS